jgi:hypothetical protein
MRFNLITLFWVFFCDQMQLSQRVSTFKDSAEQESPLKKAENEYISLILKKECKDSNKQESSDQGEEEKKTSLGKGEDTDDR